MYNLLSNLKTKINSGGFKIENQSNGGERRALNIPIGSRFPLYAGICMLIGICALATQSLNIGICSLLAIISSISFAILAFLPKKNIKFFLVPAILYALCLFYYIPGLIEYMQRSGSIDILYIIYSLLYIALPIILVLINTKKIHNKMVLIICSGAIFAINIYYGSKSLLENVLYIIPYICYSASFFLLSLGLDNNPNKKYYADIKAEQASKAHTSEAHTSGMRNAKKVAASKLVLLYLFTCGIYPLVWYYKTTRYLRQYSNENPGGAIGEFLLILFIPFYSIYWFYKYSKILYNEKRASGE